jgi:hypothetical protein
MYRTKSLKREMMAMNNKFDNGNENRKSTKRTKTKITRKEKSKVKREERRKNLYVTT